MKTRVCGEIGEKIEIREKIRFAPRRITLSLHVSHTKFSKETTKVSKFFITRSLIQNKSLHVFLYPTAHALLVFFS